MSDLNEQLRAAFEEWAIGPDGPWTKLGMRRCPDGTYRNEQVQDQWDCWQAARRAPAAAPAPTDDELWDQTIRERDHAQDMADKLAEAIAKYFDEEIGEHSNVNCPWHEALDVIGSWHEQATAAAPIHAAPAGMVVVSIDRGRAVYDFIPKVDLATGAHELYAAAVVVAPTVGTAAPVVQPVGDYVLRDMLAIQEACGLHTDEYAPGSVIEYIKELEADAAPSATAEAKDAARYRWIRHPETVLCGVIDEGPQYRYGEALDKAIDAAIASSAGEVKGGGNG